LRPVTTEDAQTPLSQWASQHGFTPSERRLQGETPFLRLGLMRVTTDAHAGSVDGHAALVSDFWIDGAGLPGFGDTALQGTPYTVLLVAIDAPEWPRLTVHPAAVGDQDWLTRLLHHDDHRLRSIEPEFDRRFRSRAANSISDDQVAELFGQDFVGWCLAQPDLLFDVENNDETGDSLVVAGQGLAGERVPVDRLVEQARELLRRLERTV
jgi:hypothetical protein